MTKNIFRFPLPFGQPSDSSSKSSSNAKTAPKDQASKELKRLQQLWQQDRYDHLLSELQRIRRKQPDFEFAHPESEIALLWGEQELANRQYRRAEIAFRKTLALDNLDPGAQGAAYHGLAQALLGSDRLDQALTEIGKAFSADQLTRPYNICYLKLLLLKGEWEHVQQLITSKSKHFPAPHLHWVRGVLALQQAQEHAQEHAQSNARLDPDLSEPSPSFSAALEHFGKINPLKDPNGDRHNLPQLWQAYTYLHSNQTSLAREPLEIHRPISRASFVHSGKKSRIHPGLERLQILYWLQPEATEDLKTLELHHLPAEGSPFHTLGRWVLLLKGLESEQWDEAAIALENLGAEVKTDPTLKALRRPINLASGLQALEDDEPELAVEYWKPLLAEQFDPHLAVYMLFATRAAMDWPERQRILTRLLKWLEPNPEGWDAAYYTQTLARTHCRIGEAALMQNRLTAAAGAVRRGAELCPEDGEVLCYQGMIAGAEGKSKEEVNLLQRGLEKGAKLEVAYAALLETLEEIGTPEQVRAARKQFGRTFGDIVENEPDPLPDWIRALSAKNFGAFQRQLRELKGPSPALEACRIFQKAAIPGSNPSSKVTLKNNCAPPDWQPLLAQLDPEAQIDPLEAIALCLLRYVKREKGFAAILNPYISQLDKLRTQVPIDHRDRAQQAYLVVFAFKTTSTAQLSTALNDYLSKAPLPGHTLAALQLHARCFNQTKAFRSAILQALKHEPQNPLLLLAQATTETNPSQYRQLKDQAFELARRIQDQDALQAIRNEEAFTQRNAVFGFGGLGGLGGFLDAGRNSGQARPGSMEAQLDRMIEQMIEAELGDDISPIQRQIMIPILREQLKQELLGNRGLSFFDDDDDDDDDDIGGFFGFGGLDFLNPPNHSQKPPKSKKRKRR